MNRTKGSRLINQYDRWELWVKVVYNGQVKDYNFGRLCSQKEVVEEYRSLETEFGRAKLLQKQQVQGVITEVVALLRQRGMTEQLDV